MKKIKAIIISAFMVLGIGLVLVPQSASAINVFNSCSSTPGSEVCKGSNDQADGLIKKLVNTLLFIVGALAVVMIIVGGIMYTTSNGDQNNIERAKSIVIYSVVGLVVSFIAYAIVNWVVGLF